MYLDDREGAVLCPMTEEQEEFADSVFDDRDFCTFRFIPLSTFKHLGYPVTVEVERHSSDAYRKASEEYFERFHPDEPAIVFREMENHPFFKKFPLSYFKMIW